MLWLPLLPGPCMSGATGGVQEGDKRQLKPVEVGHAPPPGLLAGRGRTGPLGLLGEPLLPDRGDQGSDSPSSLHAPPAQAFPGRGVPPCASSRAPHLPLSPCSRQDLRVHCLPFLGVSGLGACGCQNLFLHIQPDSLQAFVLAFGVQIALPAFLARPTVLESAFVSQGNTFPNLTTLPRSSESASGLSKVSGGCEDVGDRSSAPWPALRMVRFSQGPDCRPPCPASLPTSGSGHEASKVFCLPWGPLPASGATDRDQRREN